MNQYLDLESGEPVCRTVDRCEPGLVFWPPDKTCYQLYTQERGIVLFDPARVHTFILATILVLGRGHM